MPAPMIADCLNHNLRFTRSVEDISSVVLTIQEWQCQRAPLRQWPQLRTPMSSTPTSRSSAMVSRGSWQVLPGVRQKGCSRCCHNRMRHLLSRDLGMRAQRTFKDGALSSASTIPQKLAWQRSRRLTVFKGDFTVDDDPVVAFGLLDPPPLASRQVLGHFRG
jgi:hypothetical protein